MITKLTPTDFPALSAIEQRINPTPWSLKEFESSFTSGYLGFALRSPDEKILAYSIISSVLDEAELLLIGVLPEYQHQGLGSQLWHFIAEDLAQKNIQKIFLEVRVSNEKAISFYKKIGFVEINRRKDYYAYEGGREDAVVMTARIPAV